MITAAITEPMAIVDAKSILDILANVLSPAILVIAMTPIKMQRHDMNIKPI